MTAAPKEFQVVGKSVPKVDAMGLACGQEPYVVDLAPADALCGYIVPSPHAHARIKRIDTAKARAMKGVHAVITWKDLPRNPHTTAGQGYVEPSPYDSFILDDKVRYVGDRVALIAAETREIAEEAGRALEIEWEVLPAILDPEKAMEPGAPVIHDEPEAFMPIPVPYDAKQNLAAGASMGAGDLQKALASSHLVHRGAWKTHYAQHCPLETHGCYGYLDGKDRIVLVSATQVPFHARRITAQALGIPVRRVRVIKPRIGGGFGSKQEVMLEQCVAAMVLKTRRKVLLKLTRQEEFNSRTRHPMKVSLEGGFNADGTINGLRMDVLSNTGAYGGHALTVMTNSGSKVLPLYRMKAVAFDAKAVYTNLPVGGAYRGYGATQAAFAMECFLDEVAEKLKLDPVELRRRDHIVSGEGSPVFAALGEGGPGVEMKVGSCGLPQCIELGAKAIGWDEKRGKPGDGPKKRGLGMCTLMQGSSIPEVDMASVSLRMNDDGSFILTAGATDLGTGADTMLAQVAAEVLGVRETDIVVHTSDTDFTPFDVGAYASSTTYLSGEASRRAALDIALQIREVAADYLNEVLKIEPRPDPVKLVLREGKVFAPGGESVTLAQVAMRSLYERDQHQNHCDGFGHLQEEPAAVLRAVRRGRGRHRDGRREGAQVRGGGRLRHGHQPPARRGADRGRGAQRHQLRADRGVPVRRARARPQRQLPRLQDLLDARRAGDRPHPRAHLRGDRAVRRQERLGDRHQRAVSGHRQRHLRRGGRAAVRDALHAGEGAQGDSGEGREVVGTLPVFEPEAACAGRHS
ncbi:MAG: molybdopterin-dependent oxidoreductase [Myxococcales bacterium]